MEQWKCDKGPYICRPCQFFVCKEHKAQHILWGPQTHSFKKLRIRLTTHKRFAFVETISSKIKIINNGKNK